MDEAKLLGPRFCNSTLSPAPTPPLADQPSRHNIVAMSSHTELRAALLNLHKSLVDAERRDYERSHGRLENAAFLKVLMEDAQFVWLKPLTALIVRIDEALEDDDGGAQAMAPLAGELRSLLMPDNQGSAFQKRYGEILQRSPESVVEHGRTLRALGAKRFSPTES